MRRMRWTYPALALLVAAACGQPDQDAYAGTPSEEEAVGTEETATMADTMAAYSEWDADASGDLDQSEFASWWNERFAELGWNTDQTEGLTEEEFYQGLVQRIDENGDGQVSQEEWQSRALSIWGADEEPTNWAELDEDGDLTVTLEEARSELEDEDIFGAANEGERGDDELIDDEELGAWFRDLFDTNDDDRIGADEWDANWFERNF